MDPDARAFAAALPGSEFENSEWKEVHAKVRDRAKRSPRGSLGQLPLCRVPDPKSGDGLREIDFGAGHSSGAKSLSDRVLGPLKANVLLNESPGPAT
jgi:hypothetical protein